MAVTLQEGDKAPNFKSIDQNGNPIKLTDFKGKNVILFFYPADDTPVCTKEACNFRDNHQYWLDKGYVVLGVSPDDEVSHQKFIKKFDLPYTLIVDTNKKILDLYGTWGEKNMYGNIVQGVLRTTFVIDQKGVITKIFKRPKTATHTEEIVAALTKLNKL